MDIRIRSLREDERTTFIRVADTAFGSVTSNENAEQGAERSRQRVPIERMMGAFDNEQLVGTTYSLPSTMTLCGLRDVDLAWIVAVTTLPSHRRKGVMTQLLSSQLQSLRHEGFTLAGLAARTGHYRRAGFAVAAAHADVTFGEVRPLIATEQWPGYVEFTTAPDVESLKQLHDVVSRRTVGEIRRDPQWWTHSRHDNQGHILLWTPERELAAWASYRTDSSGWGTKSRTTMVVNDFVTKSPQARRAMWNLVLGFDGATEIIVRFVPLDDPIFRLIAHPDAVESRITESPWMRILHVPKALGQRSYSHPMALDIRVIDTLIAENNATFHLTISDNGDATCDTSTATPDVTIDIADLSSALNGYVRFRQLRDAGLAQCTDEVAVALDAAFSSRDIPFCSLFIV